MSDLFWLTDARMARMAPFFQSHPASHALMTGVASVGLSSLSAMVCAGVMHPPPMNPTRRFTAVGGVGAQRAFSLG